MEKSYDPKQVESRWYQFWLERGYFTADLASKSLPYCIVMPPPNITGSLHMGHALNSTIQDILIRWRRMQGRDALWIAGTDHAGIATQNIVEKQLVQEGVKPRIPWQGSLCAARVGMEGPVREHHHRATETAGCFLRLEPAAIHHGRGPLARSPRGVRQSVS